MTEPERCTATVDTLGVGIVECHGYHRDHPPPHRHIHDDSGSRALIEWYDDRRGYGVTPLYKPSDYIEELQRTIIDAANYLCPAIEGNTEDLDGDLDAGYRILRTAVEDINHYD